MAAAVAAGAPPEGAGGDEGQLFTRGGPNMPDNRGLSMVGITVFCLLTQRVVQSFS